jgi:hypothetical protein
LREQQRYPLAGKVVVVLANASRSTVMVQDRDERVFVIRVSWLRGIDDEEPAFPEIEPSSYWWTVVVTGLIFVGLLSWSVAEGGVLPHRLSVFAIMVATICTVIGSALLYVAFRERRVSLLIDGEIVLLVGITGFLGLND